MLVNAQNGSYVYNGPATMPACVFTTKTNVQRWLYSKLTGQLALPCTKLAT